jgi:hypothetical protein
MNEMLRSLLMDSAAGITIPGQELKRIWLPEGVPMEVRSSREMST